MSKTVPEVKNAVKAVDNISFTVSEGEFISGASGSVKTALLSILSTVESVSSGELLKDGKVWNEIYKGDRQRKDFYDAIVTVTSASGGEADVC